MIYRFCRIIFVGIVALYVIALAFLAIGTYGLFGQDQDPLSGIFLIPLGYPWNFISMASIPESALIWVGTLAPLVNIAILFWLCRRTKRTSD